MSRRMKRIGVAGTVASAVLLAAAGVLAHDEETGGPNDVAPNRRDNIIPFFEAGDPKTRHDSDPDNDETRDDVETRRSWQRWRDEVRDDGSQGEVGEGCMDQYCNSVSDDQGRNVRVDHTLSVGPASRPGDWNRVRVKALGAGAVVDLGGTQKNGPLGLPSGENAGVYDPDSGGDENGIPASPQAHSGESDLEPDDPTAAGAPTELHVNHSPDHSWLGLAHSSSDHGNESEFASADTHGGTIWVDAILPTAEEPTRFRDTKAGNSIVEHLSCPTCTDEYHEVWLDPERTIFQVGEMPDQTEHVARNPDRWLSGHEGGQPEDQLNTPVKTVADPLFEEVVNPWVDPVASSATGVGAARSLCCAPKPCPEGTVLRSVGVCCADPDDDLTCEDVANAGRFCNRNQGGNVLGIVENQAIAGCLEVDENNCFGGGTTDGEDTDGCMVVNGDPMRHMEPVSAEECTAVAVDACCAHGACL